VLTKCAAQISAREARIVNETHDVIAIYYAVCVVSAIEKALELYAILIGENRFPRNRWWCYNVTILVFYVDDNLKIA